jgi:hypothetical protein
MPNPHNSAETCEGCMFFASGKCLRYPPQVMPTIPTGTKIEVKGRFSGNTTSFGGFGTTIRGPLDGTISGEGTLSGGASGEPGSYQPKVSRNDWCGEYTPVPSKRRT